VKAVPEGWAALLPIAELAKREGVELFVVGGSVRDGLLNRSTRDIDLVLESDPVAFARACERKWGGQWESFGRFGTVRMRLNDGLRLDLARARTEQYRSPAELPIVRPASIIEDLARRDFSVNAMAALLTPKGLGELLDPHGGEADLKARRLRVLHARSFQDDPTRLFRAARYAGRLGLRLEAGTRRLVDEAVAGRYPARLSRERVRQELVRLLEEKDPAAAMRLARNWGILAAVHPDFRWPSAARRVSGAMERLGVAATAMPRGKGEEMLASLPLEKAAARQLRAALEVCQERACARAPLGEISRAVLTAAVPGLAPAALSPVLLRAADLRAAGCAPGKDFSRWIAAAARAQWRGEFEDADGARNWLRRRLGRAPACGG